jgi:hypothetical protein
MTEITYFIVMPFDYIDDGIVAGEPMPKSCRRDTACARALENFWPRSCDSNQPD